MSHKSDNPFDDEFEDDNSGESLLSTRDLAQTLRSGEFGEEFDGTFSVPKLDTKSKKYDRKFFESEDLEDKNQTVEINSPTDSKGKAEVYINRMKNGELDSIEVIASNGERILIKFEVADNIEPEENQEEEKEEDNNI